MKRAFLREHGKAGLELIEEACVLLRTCPASILATYFLGSVPFAAGFLIFFSDLSRHPDAPGHLGSATLAMSALFIWMKFFHARFGAMLLARLRGELPPSWAPGGVFRSACLQTILHSTGLFLLPIAMIVTLPFGWVYAFYQNLSALDDGQTRQRALFQSASQQSLLWPGQNHMLLLALSGFGLFVFLNWVTVGFFAPQLLKMFLGIESAFTRSPWSIFNTTFFAAACALTYLCVDPLTKACYVLRCFYGKSLRSGDDLKTEVRRLSGRASATVVALILCLISPRLQAAETTPPPAQTVTASELDRSIDNVVQQRKYTWRNPRDKSAETKGGPLSEFFKNIRQMVEKFGDSIRAFVERLDDWFRSRNQRSSRSHDGDWLVPSTGLLYVVLGLVACGLAIAILRLLHVRHRSTGPQETAVAITPDLEDENTTADELPEDDWTRMGRQFLEQGEGRLALRSFYLASLAHLAAGGLITIVRSKSNRDYERELRRRGHATPELPILFSENVGIIDRIWYGTHEVNLDLVQRFVGNLEKMKVVA
jgi:hypothetical protein